MQKGGAIDAATGSAISPARQQPSIRSLQLFCSLLAFCSLATAASIAALSTAATAVLSAATSAAPGSTAAILCRSLLLNWTHSLARSLLLHSTPAPHSMSSFASKKIFKAAGSPVSALEESVAKALVELEITSKVSSPSSQSSPCPHPVLVRARPLRPHTLIDPTHHSPHSMGKRSAPAAAASARPSRNASRRLSATCL